MSDPQAPGGEPEASPGPTFEEARQELEQIVSRLESGQVDLEDAVALWERGESLYRLCLARLDAAQGKVEELAARAQAARPEPS